LAEKWQSNERLNVKVKTPKGWSTNVQIQPAGEDEMFTKTVFRILYLFIIATILMGCGTASATAEPIVITPTEQAIATPTLVLPTLTPIMTEIVATTAEQLAGSWKMSTPQGNTFYLLFKTDGSLEVTRADAPKNSKPEVGKFWFEGDVFYIDDACDAGQGKYEAPHVIQRDGQNYKITFKVIEDSCEDRVRDLQKGFIWRNPQP